MAIASRQKPHGGGGELKLFRLCPFWQTGNSSNNNNNSSNNNNNNHSSSSSSSTQYLTHSHNGTNSSGIITGNRRGDANNKNASRAPTTVSSVARSLLPARRRLRLDPPNHLFFPYEPGKQVRSAIRLKNTSKSHVAFKFQTTAPKSCYMRPPGGILAPGESLIATVFKFVEQPENNEKPMDQKSKVKFKIMSLKVKGGGIDYVPELDLVDEITRMQGIALQPSSFGSVIPDSKFDEQRDQVTVERILRVVFLDVERPSTALAKLRRQLAEAEAALEARKKPPPETGPRAIGEGFVIDEWKERREKYLARQQVEAVDSA